MDFFKSSGSAPTFHSFFEGKETTPPKYTSVNDKLEFKKHPWTTTSSRLFFHANALCQTLVAWKLIEKSNISNVFEHGGSYRFCIGSGKSTIALSYPSESAAKLAYYRMFEELESLSTK